MSSSSSHYSSAQDAKRLSLKASKLAKCLHEVYEHNDHLQPVLVYSGMSGVATATAIMLAAWQEYGLPCKMVYVRKPGEDSHGMPVESSSQTFFHYNYDDPMGDVYPPRCIIFVDDFVSSGETRKRCQDAIAKMRGGKGRTIDYYALTERSDELLPMGSALTVEM